MRENLIIAGAGGMGSEVAWLLEESDFQKGRFNLLGFADDTPALQGKTVHGYPVLGTIDWLSNIEQDTCVAIGVGSSQGRLSIYQKLKSNPHISFPTLIASNVRFANSAVFGEGCIICHAGLLMPHSKIGNFVLMNIYSSVSHDSEVGDFCTINPSVKICGNTKVGYGCELGAGATIIEKQKIGDFVTIGANATVVRDIPSYTVAVGTPAKVIKTKSAAPVVE